MRGIDIFCVWDCCWPWLKFQEVIALIVFDPFVELFITLCIVVNTLFMALDHHDMDKDMEKALKSGNYVSILYVLCIKFVHFATLIYLLSVTVLYRNIRHWSYYETDSHESKVLLSSRMEYIRFHNCRFVLGRIGIGRRSRVVSVAIISLGKIYLFDYKNILTHFQLIIPFYQKD